MKTIFSNCFILWLKLALKSFEMNIYTFNKNNFNIISAEYPD